MRVLITGGTGFLGRPLVVHLAQAGHECHVLTRRESSRQVPIGMRIHHLGFTEAPWPEIDAVINLAGESVVGRWTSRKRRAVLDSRVSVTRQLADWIRLSTRPPRVFLSASAVGIYGDQPGARLDEDSALDPRKRFRYQVCSQWEREARRAAEEGKVRTVLLRLGNVLHPSGGFAGTALPWLQRGFTLVPGTGDEHVSWVSLEDVTGLITLMLDDPRWSGVVNLTAPNPVAQREFITALSAFVGRRPIGRAPAWLIQLILGEFGRAILDDQQVFPVQAEQLGYRFHHPTLAACIGAWRRE